MAAITDRPVPRKKSAQGRLLALSRLGSGRSALARPTVDFADRFAATYLGPRSAMNRHPRAPNTTFATTGDAVEPTLVAGGRLVPGMPARETICGNE